jgi:mannose-6-phosphate isomerase-like protein (cupin superfamily)
VEVVRIDALPFSSIAHELVGDEHGGAGVCLLFVDAPPGRGPSLHQHPYEEVFILTEGRGTFWAGDEEAELEAGQVLIVPANTPHRFVNTGDGPLKQIDIHVSPSFATEWLE